MSWSQDIEDPPLRERHNLYLDGLVTGAALTWLCGMLYDHIRREHSGHVGTFFLVVVIGFIAVVTAVKVWNLRKHG